MGTSETIGNLTNLFSPVDDKWRIFRRKESASARMGLVELPLSSLSRGEGNLQRTAKAQKDIEIAIPDVAQRILLEHFTPSAVIINEKGDIVYISGRTGKYLEPAAGKTNMNIFAMAREGLRIVLAGVIRSAIAQKKGVTMKCLKVKTNGDYQTIDLTVKPFCELEGMRGLLMVVFKDVGTPSKQAVSVKAKTG